MARGRRDIRFTSEFFPFPRSARAQEAKSTRSRSRIRKCREHHSRERCRITRDGEVIWERIANG
jgi:hypothetical protein